LSGELNVGAKLPSEGQLAIQFEVSRPVVREALVKLRERGLLDTVNGSGTFVRHPQPKQLGDALIRQLMVSSSDPTSLAKLFEARQAVETTLARLAALRATDEEKRRIRNAYLAMVNAAGDAERWAEADLKFHREVADASHNPFLATILSPLIEAIQFGILSGHSTEEAMTGGIRFHGMIADAIEAGAPDDAEAAMSAHMKRSRAYLEAELEGSSDIT
jgi:DNA-binding FadR family transcriptional regulator